MSSTNKMQRPAMMRIVVAALVMAMVVPSNTLPLPLSPPIITEDEFDLMLPHRNIKGCPAEGFYTYPAFIEAAKAFPNFGTDGDLQIRKREMAAFFAQAAQETFGGCFLEESGGDAYCDPSSDWECLPGRKYFGRGALLLRWNYNYGDAGSALGTRLLHWPRLVSGNATLSFETALWLWMTQRSEKIPSCHDVIVDKWVPSEEDYAAGRLPGFGTTTNVLLSTNGAEQECGSGDNQNQALRIRHYQGYCNILQVVPGDNLDCYHQIPFLDPSLSAYAEVL